MRRSTAQPGPVQVTYPDAMYGGPQMKAFVAATVGLTHMTELPDLNGGKSNCVSITPLVRVNTPRSPYLLSRAYRA